MNHNPNLKPFLRVCLLISSMLCGLSILLPMSAEGALRGVAGGGSSSGGGGTTGCTTSSGNGNIVYVSAGACTSNNSFSTDGAGAVSASVSVTTPLHAAPGVLTLESQGATTAGATLTNNNSFSVPILTGTTSATSPLISGTTSVTTPLLVGTTTQSFRGQGASTDGATVTNNIWAFNSAPTVPSLNIGASGQVLGNGVSAVDFAYNPTTLFRWASATEADFFFAGTIVTKMLSTGITTTGSISSGSYVGNSNGIELSNTLASIGAVSSGSVVSAGGTVTTGTAANVIGMPLPAGVYTMWGQCNYNLFNGGVSAGPTDQRCGISYTSATLLTQAGGTSGGATVDSGPYTHQLVPIGNTVTSDITVPVQPVKVKCTSTCTIFLVGQITFANGTVKLFGDIHALRIQ